MACQRSTTLPSSPSSFPILSIRSGPSRRQRILLLFAAFVAFYLLVPFRGISLVENLQPAGDAPQPKRNIVQTADNAAQSDSPVSVHVSTNNELQDKQPLPISFSLIMWSEPSAVEGALLLKSIMMHTSQPVDIHIVCDGEAERTLRARLDLVTRPRYRTRVRFYKPSFQKMLERIEREGTLQTDHSAGIPGLMKLFLQEILPPSVGKTIFVDTDAFFISDPALLWNAFLRMKDSTAISMGSHPDQFSPEWNHASRICSCVILLDLGKLRSLRLMDSSLYHMREGDDQPPALSPPAFRKMYGLPGSDGKGRYDNVKLGDQGYWWAIIQFYPELFTPLPFDYEVTSCLMDTYLTGLGDEMRSEEDEMRMQIHVKDTPQEGKIVLPKLLHFNCLEGDAIYFRWPGWKDPNNPLNQRWGAAMSYHVGYKWIWLNQGEKDDPDSRLEIHVTSKVIFADQRLHDSGWQRRSNNTQPHVN